MHDYQLSQFRPTDSQRSRNVPDVLFVDEEGNPIEAGEENLIFVDETGLEMTEDNAISLIESGKFVDSRILYDDELGPYNRSNSASLHASTNSFSNLTTALMAKSNSMLQAQKSNSLTHAQIQAVQAAQIAHTQALLNAAPTPASTADTMADVFAQAQSRAREQAAELAEIEADAASTNYAESYHQVEKTKSDRRLPLRPEKKPYDSNNSAYAEETYELDRIISEQEKRMKSSESHLSHKSSSFHAKQRLQEENILRQQELEERERKAHAREEEEREYIKELLLQKQEELMEQHIVEKRQQEREKRHAEKEEKRRLKAERKAERRARKQREAEERREEEERQAKRERELEQQRLLEEEARLERQLREMERKREEKEERERNEAEIRKVHRHQKKSYSTLAPSVSAISKTSSITKISQKSSDSTFVGDRYSSSTNAKSNTSYSRASTNNNSYHKTDKTHSTHNSYSNYKNNNSGSYLTNRTRRSIEAYAKDYDVVQVKQVGQLRGSNMIRDYNNVDLDQFDKYYEAGNLEFEPHHLDTHSTQFIDPFSPDLFKDEMVDIDFGAIDAFTEALHAQILAEKNGTEPAKNLQFPSHVIASNHAAFLDTQVLMGDVSGSQAGNERSGVNVQFITPNLRSKTASSATTGSSSRLEKVARDEYARNQSFGSAVDVQRMSKSSGGSGMSGGSYIQNQLNKHTNVSHQSLVR